MFREITACIYFKGVDLSAGYSLLTLKNNSS